MVEHVAPDTLDADPHAVAFEDPRTVCLQLDAGEEVAPHSHPGYDVIVVVLAGRLSLRLDGDAHAVAAGEAIRFDGEREVAPQGEAETTALVVLSES